MADPVVVSSGRAEPPCRELADFTFVLDAAIARGFATARARGGSPSDSTKKSCAVLRRAYVRLRYELVPALSGLMGADVAVTRACLFGVVAVIEDVVAWPWADAVLVGDGVVATRAGVVADAVALLHAHTGVPLAAADRVLGKQGPVPVAASCGGR